MFFTLKAIFFGMSKENKPIKENKRCCSIGGQAVLEGVMMRGEKSMATAVRDADGIIRVESKRIKPAKQRNFFFRLPIIRGVVSFVQSLVGGTRVLMRSAEVYGEGEPSNFEKWLAKTFKVNIYSAVSFVALALGLFLAVFLFMWLPQTVRVLLSKLFKVELTVLATNFIEGGLKLVIFILYILLCSLLKDIRRTFMYHGAEHKTISCYENGLDLTVQNVKTCKRVHDRCGTTFIVFVMVISIILFALFESLVGKTLSGLLRVICKLAILPLVAGLSYELLKGLAKTNSKVFYPLKVLGLLLQKITTREPDEDMIEVALTSFKLVLKMDADESIPEVEFILPQKRKDLLDNVVKELKENGITELAEAEWIVSLTLGIKRSELYTDDIVMPKNIDVINKVIKERITGRPLWYCIGNVDFYGYTINVDERVLIPRPETEILVENALKIIDGNSKVLDLCTGSGAIAIAVSKEKGASVVASDVSEQALSLARENSILNQCDVEFVQSNMFEGLGNRKFDVILSNPPYIKNNDIASLQDEVKNFEPLLALDGGEDGLDFYRIISKNARDFLNEKGVILMEIGFDQGQDVVDLFKDYTSVEIIKDYENNDRIIKAVL